MCPRDGTKLELGTDFFVGLELRDTYRVTHKLGDGGLGRVYHATHLRVTRSYAVKVPRGIWVDHPKARLRFFNEAAAASRLSHPNIASVVDIGETDTGIPYFVMELAEGMTLTEYLAKGPVAVHEALSIVRQIAAALVHAHENGVVHRDLKPDNVMIHAGHVRVVDFGLAILTDRGDEGRFTTTGFTVGTPHYMAPEQLLANKIDERTDLYALGAVLFELLVGRKPYAGTTVEYIHQVVAGKVPTFKERAPSLQIDPSVEKFCRTLMAREPANRPKDAAAVIEQVDLLLESVAPARVRARGSTSPVRQDDGYGDDDTALAVAPGGALRARWWNPFTWRCR